MKDKNGIEIMCENCVNNGACTSENNCKICPPTSCVQYVFEPHRDALKARIEELQEQNELLKKAVFVNKDMDNLGEDFDIGKRAE